MYTRQEISKQKQAFWTSFGRYLKPILSADGEVISWSNYKTGIRGINFKMDADTQKASISIVLSPTDGGFYERFLQLRSILNETLREKDWSWNPSNTDEYGKAVGTISKTLPGVNVLRTEDWPAIISFLKPRIIALDSFWSLVKYGFEDLL